MQLLAGGIWLNILYSAEEIFFSLHTNTTLQSGDASNVCSFIQAREFETIK